MCWLWRTSSNSGASPPRWGSFAVRGVKLLFLRAANRAPLSYELRSANVADVRLTESCSRGNLAGGAAIGSAWMSIEEGSYISSTTYCSSRKSSRETSNVSAV